MVFYATTPQLFYMVLLVIKLNMLQFVSEVLIPKDFKIALLVQELRQFCWMGEFFLLDKVVKLVGRVSVINGAYPV